MAPYFAYCYILFFLPLFSYHHSLFSHDRIHHILLYYHIRLSGLSVAARFVSRVFPGHRVALQLAPWPSPLLSDLHGVCSGLGVVARFVSRVSPCLCVAPQLVL